MHTDHVEQGDRLAHGIATELVGQPQTDLIALRSALRSRAGALHWHSPGSRSFQAVLHELLSQLGASGSRLTELAAAVRAHRHRAAGRAAELAAAVRSPLVAVEHLARLP